MISSTRASASHNCLNNRLLLRPHFSHFFVPLFCWRPPWGVRDRFSPVFGNCRIRGDHCCYGFSFRLNGFPQNHPISLERILIQRVIHFSPTPSPQEALSDPVSLRQLRKNWPQSMYCVVPSFNVDCFVPSFKTLVCFHQPVSYLPTSKCDTSGRPATHKSTIRHHLQSLSVTSVTTHPNFSNFVFCISRISREISHRRAQIMRRSVSIRN